MDKKRICVDFDGVIAVHDAGQGVHHFGGVINGAREFLTKLREKYYVSIFTCRCNPELNEKMTVPELKELVEDWLKANNMPFDEVYTGIGKPIATAYIDDKAILCLPEEFKGAYNYVLSELGFKVI